MRHHVAGGRHRASRRFSPPRSGRPQAPADPPLRGASRRRAVRPAAGTGRSAPSTRRVRPVNRAARSTGTWANSPAAPGSNRPSGDDRHGCRQVERPDSTACRCGSPRCLLAALSRRRGQARTRSAFSPPRSGRPPARADPLRQPGASGRSTAPLAAQAHGPTRLRCPARTGRVATIGTVVGMWNGRTNGLPVRLAPLPARGFSPPRSGRPPARADQPLRGASRRGGQADRRHGPIRSVNPASPAGQPRRSQHKRMGQLACSARLEQAEWRRSARLSGMRNGRTQRLAGAARPVPARGALRARGLRARRRRLPTSYRAARPYGAEGARLVSLPRAKQRGPPHPFVRYG